MFAFVAPLQTGGGSRYWPLVWFVLVIIAAVVGARGGAEISVAIGRLFVLLFISLAVVVLLL